MIQKVTPYVYYNQWLKRLNTQLNESTNQNPIKVTKVVKLINIKTLLKTLRTINSPLAPSFLGRYSNSHDFKKRGYLIVGELGKQDTCSKAYLSW